MIVAISIQTPSGSHVLMLDLNVGKSLSWRSCVKMSPSLTDEIFVLTSWMSVPACQHPSRVCVFNEDWLLEMLSHQTTCSWQRKRSDVCFYRSSPSSTWAVEGRDTRSYGLMKIQSALPECVFEISHCYSTSRMSEDSTPQQGGGRSLFFLRI